MRINDWLLTATQRLTQAAIPTARLDALVLLEDAVDTDRAKLLAYPDTELTIKTVNVLAGQIARRATHEPLAYIRGKSEFYGREFIVSPAVLEPRPESETMIDLLKDYLTSHPGLISGIAAPADPSSSQTVQSGIRIADVGTGSGALGITAALELPGATVELLEISAEAIEVAKSNVIKFTAGVSVLQTDLLEGSSRNYHILLCNLPYVPDEHVINLAASHEPALAIFGGPDGLDLFRTLFQQIHELEKRPLLILTESLPLQHDTLCSIAAELGYKQDREDDFIQAFVPSDS